MWSYIQDRRIAQQVRRDLDKFNVERTQQDEKKKNERIWVVADDDDPLNPLNWSLLSRTKNIAILSLLIFTQAWAGAAESVANSAASQEFGVSRVAENLSTAMYLFGIGSGSLFVGPISETLGRNPTYLSATFCYLMFVLGTALSKSFGGFIVCRYLVGLFGSATLAINGSSVQDMFRPVKRSFVFPVIAWANVAAPAIAPIAGGWISTTPSLGWRWTEWITLIISAFAFLVALLFLPETYLPILLDWKARHLRQATGSSRYVSHHASSSPSFIQLVKTKLVMPVTFFTTEPVIAVLGGYLILLYALLFSFLSGFDYVFKNTYDLSTGLEGSCFGAIAAGATAFTLLAPGLYSWARHRTAFVHGSDVLPEFRLWPAMLTGPLLPVSLFWLGWTNFSSVSIWSGLGACFVFGVCLIAIYVSAYEYIIDSYKEHAAIALASITMVRYFVAGGIAMAARPMYEGIGVHWTMTLWGCVAVLLAPAPVAFWWWGKGLRERSKFAVGEEEGQSPAPSRKREVN
ncbi:major facilitator superfamily domain-containing protein [Mycena capillaripes]|nr:major facilitator superfamily domain-containing protein [Mycena capillaripes]